MDDLRLLVPGIWNGLCVAPLVYFIFAAFSRLLFHPLREFPGPKLAALTWWYEAYYELIKDGGMVEQIEKLHEIYGPVVRVAPDQLHFSDPQAYGDIYHFKSKFPKDSRFYSVFLQDESTFGCIDHHGSKIRRDILNPLFSRRSILKLEHVVQEKVDKLIELLSLAQHSVGGKSVNMAFAFRSTTLDIITSYCFGHCYDALAASDFKHPLLVAMNMVSPMIWAFKHFPFLKMVVNWPLNTVSRQLANVKKHCSDQIDSILANPASLENAEHETIYHHLMTPHPDKGQPEIPSKKSLQEEAFSLFFAGSDTVGNACTVGSFHVLNDKAIHTRLVNELDEAWPDKDIKMGYEKLEKLPYLTAVIKESLRMSHGVINGLPRIVSPDSALIAGLNVPAGTVVSMGASLLHNNPDIFPNPFTFSPDRWLQPNSRELETFFVPFSKGPRSCLGINLAWCELYLIFGHLFRKIDLVIDGTTIHDLKTRAYFLQVYRGRPLHAFAKERSV